MLIRPFKPGGRGVVVEIRAICATPLHGAHATAGYYSFYFEKNIQNIKLGSGFRSRSRPEPGYWAGAGAVYFGPAPAPP